MQCPFCENEDTKVTDTRSSDKNKSIKRRRLCEKCNERFTTYERIHSSPLYVIKNDKTREPFDRDKLLKGIILSCNKRPISIEDIEKLVNSVENYINSFMKQEISSEKIGEIIMDKLKALDEIAYVRFASVYRKFKDVDSFINEVRSILEEKKFS